MRYPKVKATFLLLLTCIFFIPSARGQSAFLRRTNLTFSAPVEIPGKMLPAGSYVFQLMPSNDTNLVIIRDKDEDALATILTIPDYRMTPTAETVITFKEQAANAPPAIKSWFYPGENFGHEFIYPMRKAIQLAAANNENVPAIPDQTADNELESATVTTVTPTDAQAQVAEASPAPDNQNQTLPANNATADTNNNNLVAQNDSLPKTASPIYLIALSGMFSFGIAGILSVLGRRLRSHEDQSGL